MKAIAMICAIFISATLSGCATMMERSAHKSCFSKDWLAEGFDSATSGQAYQKSWKRADKKCEKHNVWSNHDDFARGYELGLEAFCVEENGFEFGWRNLTYQPICDEDQQYYFDTAYKDGHILHKARNYLDRTESELYEAQQFIEYATHRRRDLAHKIDSGTLDEHAEKRAVKERYRLKGQRESARNDLISLRATIREAEHRRAALQHSFFEQYYPEGEGSGSAYSKDQTLVSENIVVTEPALLLYRPLKFEPGTSSYYRTQINAVTKHITETYSRKLRYQVIQDAVITFSLPNQKSLELAASSELAQQPHLLIWFDQKLERLALTPGTPLSIETIDSAAKKILSQRQNN